MVMDERAIIARHTTLVPNGSLGNIYVQFTQACCRLIEAVARGAYWGDRQEVHDITDIGARVVNTCGVFGLVASAGYWASAEHCKRDLVECAQLLEFFRYFPEEIRPWKQAEGIDRYKRYGFGPVAQKLGVRRGPSPINYKDGFNSGSNYGSHPSGESLSLQVDEAGTQKTIGPTYNALRFRLSLLQMWENTATATGQFAQTIDAMVPGPRIDERFRFLTAAVIGGNQFMNEITEEQAFDWIEGKLLV
jgi:hypothetical protein